MFSFGILGINARNLLYIKKFNNKKSIKLADNKYNTKTFLSERGIPVGKTYAFINSKEQLNNFDFSKLDSNFIVFKPNKGSQGEGIIITELIGGKKNDLKSEGQLSDSFGYSFKIGNEIIGYNDLKRILFDILDGKYSITGGTDSILIEEKLIPNISFGEFCKYGLADIRIIVFKLVPVAAMIRVPTINSNGKANLKQGGIGLGVDIASGVVKSMILNGKTYSNNFPDGYENYLGKKIQYWDNILLYSSKIQFFVNLGYLALDWVITESGPKLLEINARAGLEVQNACRLPLRNRLNKLSNISINDPEKGVEIAKSLFSNNVSNAISDTKILYKSQTGNLKTNNEIGETIVKIDIDVSLKSNNTIVSKEIYNLLTTSKTYTLSIDNSDIIFDNFKYVCTKKNEVGKIILGGDIIKNFYIKPIKKIENKLVEIKGVVLSELKIIQLLDTELHEIGIKLNLSKILKPTNYIEELDKFVNFKGNYNPIFNYNFPSTEKIDEIIKKLYIFKKTYDPELYKSKLFILFSEKIDELIFKSQLILAYTKQDYENIKIYNEKLYGLNDESIYSEAKENFFKISKINDIKSLGKVMSMNNVIIKTKEFLKNNGINDIGIEFSNSNTSRISVNYKNTPKIIISSGAIFYEKQLDSILAHEILVHLRRYLNGELTGLNIFKNGTGFYLLDEEGFAIYNSIKYLPEDYYNNGIYKKYFLSIDAINYDFKTLGNLVQSFNFDKSLHRIFNEVLRLKKGLTNTSNIGIGTVYEKDKTYLRGYLKIKEWIENGGDEKLLYFGKIKIEDIKVIN